jgi:UPF0755 protein
MRVATKRKLAVVGILAVILGGIAFANKSQIRSAIEAVAGNDYPGPGNGSVQIKVTEGESGSDVVAALVANDVVKSSRFAMRLATEQNIVFYPGTYKLQHQMRAVDALAILGKSGNAISNRVTIKEGLRIGNVFKALSAGTSIPVTEFEAAAQRLSDFQVGSGAPSLEGYLFPATYEFSPDATAREVLLMMNKRMIVELESFGIPKAKWHSVLTLAGLIQSEARRTEDFYKVSRVFLNRIDVGMKLQSDATVSYGVGGNTVSTSAADRANDNAYNTYLHAGLPIGPISAPGHVAIDAALHPSAGTWVYFCAVNLETGETWFSTTYAEHAKAVSAWRAWMKEHPGYE